MRRRRSWLWWSIPTLVLIAGGVVAVVSSRPAKIPPAPHEHGAADPHADWQSQLPPGHPDISGKMPQAKPLTPEQAATGECPFMATQKASPAKPPKT